MWHAPTDGSSCFYLHNKSRTEFEFRISCVDRVLSVVFMCFNSMTFESIYPVVRRFVLRKTYGIV